MAFTYPSSGGSSPAPALSSALQVSADAPALYYTARATKANNNSNSWYKNNLLIPVMFNRDMTITDLATRFNSIPNSGTMPNGADMWYTIYEGYDYPEGNKPKTLVANAGIQNITDSAGSNATWVKTLATPVTFKAYTTYWIGRAYALSDGAGGTTDGNGPTYRLMIDGGHDPQASTGLELDEIGFAHTGFVAYYSQDIADATWGTAPATLTGDLYPQNFSPITYIKGEPA